MLVRILMPLVAIVFIGFMTVGMPLPVLPILVNATMSKSAIMVGGVVGLQSLTTVLTRQYAGSVVDRQGPKTATIRGLALCAMVGLIYMASQMSGPPLFLRFVILLSGRMVLGVAESLILTGAITWGIARIGEENSGRVMSWNGIAMYAALAVGAPAGLAIYNLYPSPQAGFSLLGLIVAVLPILALFIAAVLPSVKPVKGPLISARSLLAEIWPLGTVLTLQMVGFATIAAFLTLTYSERGWQGAGLAFTGFGAAVIAARMLFGAMRDRLGGYVVAIASLIVELVGQMLLWAAPDPWIASLGCVVTGFGCALAFPALGVEAMKRVSAANRGAFVGLFSAFQDIAFGLTGPVTGIVAERFGYQSVFLTGAAAAVMALIILTWQYKRSMS